MGKIMGPNNGTLKDPNNLLDLFLEQEATLLSLIFLI
jgi:hypothetical protein